mmetsp:Transcript_24182/g.28493  ORF Transcript_24182/g.28493 Transcript_24182/m.28493 type:complete len:93 (+) Transcript_24182:50-328(+)
MDMIYWWIHNIHRAYTAQVYFVDVVDVADEVEMMTILMMMRTEKIMVQNWTSVGHCSRYMAVSIISSFFLGTAIEVSGGEERRGQKKTASSL